MKEWFRVQSSEFLVSGFWFLVSSFWFLVSGSLPVGDPLILASHFVNQKPDQKPETRPETRNQKPETLNFEP